MAVDRISDLLTLSGHRVPKMSTERPLRITLLAEYYLPRLGGVEVFVADLAERLGARGHRVQVVTTTPASPSGQGARVPSFDAHVPQGVEVVRVPTWGVPGMGVPLSPRLPGRIRAVLGRDPSDIVHVHASIYSVGALAGGWAARSLGLPIALTVHSVLGGAARVHRLANAVTGWGNWPHVVAGPSRAVADEVAGVLGRAVGVLPNGVDVAWWREGRTPRVPDPGTLRLVTVQRLKGRKRGSAVVEAVAAAAAGLPPDRRIELTVVGDGPRRASIAARARELEVPVRFTGAVSRVEVRQELARADAFVLASTREAFGLAATEARAAGLPVIAFRTGALEDLVPDGRAGILVDDDASLVRAIRRLAAEPELLARLTDESVRLAPPFDWDGVAEAHERSYREAIERAGAGAR